MLLGLQLELRLLSTETFFTEIPSGEPRFSSSAIFLCESSFLNIPPEDNSDTSECICNGVTRNHPITRLVSCGLFCLDQRCSFSALVSAHYRTELHCPSTACSQVLQLDLSVVAHWSKLPEYSMSEDTNIP